MERFWNKVDRENGPVPEHRPDLGRCWVWTGAKVPKGYGSFSLDSNSSQVGAHRVAYELVIGEIPDGKVLDHLCLNKACVNPAHLEVVTVQENTLRGTGPTAVNARKAACPSGHDYDLLNTYFDKTGRRHCRACNRARWQRANERERVAV